MKIIILITACLITTSCFAWYPTWNPAWDNNKNQHQEASSQDKEWGHNTQKQPQQGEYDWDKKADRGVMNY